MPSRHTKCIAYKVIFLYGYIQNCLYTLIEQSARIDSHESKEVQRAMYSSCLFRWCQVSILVIQALVFQVQEILVALELVNLTVRFYRH
jgi:hypothetical protein